VLPRHEPFRPVSASPSARRWHVTKSTAEIGEKKSTKTRGQFNIQSSLTTLKEAFTLAEMLVPSVGLVYFEDICARSSGPEAVNDVPIFHAAWRRARTEWPDIAPVDFVKSFLFEGVEDLWSLDRSQSVIWPNDVFGPILYANLVFAGPSWKAPEDETAQFLPKGLHRAAKIDFLDTTGPDILRILQFFKNKFDRRRYLWRGGPNPPDPIGPIIVDNLIQGVGWPLTEIAEFGFGRETPHLPNGSTDWGACDKLFYAPGHDGLRNANAGTLALADVNVHVFMHMPPIVSATRNRIIWERIGGRKPRFAGRKDTPRWRKQHHQWKKGRIFTLHSEKPPQRRHVKHNARADFWKKRAEETKDNSKEVVLKKGKKAVEAALRKVGLLAKKKKKKKGLISGRMKKIAAAAAAKFLK